MVEAVVKTVYRLGIHPSLAGYHKVKTSFEERRRLWSTMRHNLMPVYLGMDPKERARFDEALFRYADQGLAKFEDLQNIISFWPNGPDYEIRMNIGINDLGTFVFALRSALFDRGLAILVANPELNNGWSGALALELGHTSSNTAYVALGEDPDKAHKALLDYLQSPQA